MGEITEDSRAPSSRFPALSELPFSPPRSPLEPFLLPPEPELMPSPDTPSTTLLARERLKLTPPTSTADSDTETDSTDLDTGLTDTITPALTLMATTSARDPLMPSPLPMLMPTPTTDTTDTDTDTDITDTDMEDTADT